MADISLNVWRVCEATAGGLDGRSEQHIRLLGVGVSPEVSECEGRVREATKAL